MEWLQRDAIIWIVAAIFIAVIALVFLLPISIKGWQRWRLRRLCRGKLVLSYDDGPDALLTPALLELLSRYGAKATFFLVGFRARRSPGVCEILAKSEHELGCHGDMHLHAWRVWPWRAVRDISDGYRRMREWIASDAPYRPAFGKLTAWTWLALLKRGVRVCWWTADGLDTRPELPDPARVAHDIINQGGAVVLMHNHDRGPDRHRYVLQLTEELLIAARQRSVKICTLRELYDRKGVQPDEIDGR